MQKKHHEKVNMYAAVIRQFETEPSILEYIAVLKEFLEPFKLIFGSIVAIAQKQNADLSALTDYRELKKQTAFDTMKVANTLFAWASHSGEGTIKKQVWYTLSGLQSLRNPAFGDTCMEIINYTRPYVAQLASFGTTPESLGELEKKVKAYIEAIPKRRNLKVANSQELLGLNRMFEEADSILKERFDKTMQLFKQHDKLVFDRYTANRKLVKIPVIVTQVRGVVSSANAPKGQRGIAVTLIDTGQVRYTDGRGAFRFTKLSPGMYSLQFNGEGYEPVLLKDQQVRLGQVSKCTVVLERPAVAAV